MNSLAKKRQKYAVKKGVFYITSSFNNLIVTLTDTAGRPLAAKSAGMVGFKGSRKRTNLAAEKTVTAIIEDALQFGVESANLIIKGLGYNRSAALQAFTPAKINIVSIEDKTPVPHGGCRAPKRKK